MSKKAKIQKESSFYVKSLDFRSEELKGTLHIHNEMQILAGVSGMVEIKISSRKFNLRVGDVMLIKRRTPHSAKSILPFTTTTSLKISQDSLFPPEIEEYAKYLSVILEQNEKDFVYLRREDEATAEIFSTISQIFEESTKKGKSYSLFVDGYTKILLGLLDRKGAINEYADKFDTSALCKLLPALEFVDKNYTREISLEEIASTLDMNREYFCRLFKKTLGETFVDYTNLLRISCAEELLISSQKSISEISDELGFSSVSYFTRVFKNITNLTPATFRNTKVICE